MFSIAILSTEGLPRYYCGPTVNRFSKEVAVATARRAGVWPGTEAPGAEVQTYTTCKKDGTF